MPDDNGTETTRSDARAQTTVSSAKRRTTRKPRLPMSRTPTRSPHRTRRVPMTPGSRPLGDETGSSEDLKVVVSIKGGRATIGVQQPSSDPHIESFDDADLSGLTQEVPAVIERARAKWEDEPKYPAHERPAPPARRQNRRGQGPAQAGAAEGEAEQQQQTETLRLF